MRSGPEDLGSWSEVAMLLDGTKSQCYGSVKSRNAIGRHKSVLSTDWLHFLTPAIIYYKKCIGEDFPVKNVRFGSFQLAKNLAQIL